MRTHYGPWQPCWISNQHQKDKSGRGPSSEHFWQVWLISVQRFQRRRFKYEKLTDGRTTDAYPWQKLTWPMARWAKNEWTREAESELAKLSVLLKTSLLYWFLQVFVITSLNFFSLQIYMFYKTHCTKLNSGISAKKMERKNPSLWLYQITKHKTNLANHT